MTLIVVAGCGNQTETSSESELIPFEIQTQGIYNIESMAMITKSATVQGASDIMITSQTAGRVDSIPARIGSSIEQ